MSDKAIENGFTLPVVTIELPGAFHALTGGLRQVSVEGESIREVLSALAHAVPGVIGRIMDEEGAVRRYVNIYRNDTDIRSLDSLETKVENQDVIWIVPAIAGGSGT